MPALDAGIHAWIGATLPPEMLPEDLRAMLPQFETPEFTGLVIEALSRDPELAQLSGKALIGADLGVKYGIKDLDGKQPISYRETMGAPIQPFTGANAK